MANSKVKDLKKKAVKYAREAARLKAIVDKRLAYIDAYLTGHMALSNISKVMAKGQKRPTPTKFDKMEAKILKMLLGWSVLDIECLLINQVMREVRRRARFPKR